MTSSSLCLFRGLEWRIEIVLDPLSPERLILQKISKNVICLGEKVANGGPTREVAEFAHRKEAARG